MEVTASFSGKRRRRVLVVDDEPSAADWMRDVLELEGYESRSALVGARAHDLYRQWSPDAVLVKLSLPDIDGVELISRLKDTDPSPEIVALGSAGAATRAMQTSRGLE